MAKRLPKFVIVYALRLVYSLVFLLMDGVRIITSEKLRTRLADHIPYFLPCGSELRLCLP